MTGSLATMQPWTLPNSMRETRPLQIPSAATRLIMVLRRLDRFVIACVVWLQLLWPTSLLTGARLPSVY